MDCQGRFISFLTPNKALTRRQRPDIYWHENPYISFLRAKPFSSCTWQFVCVFNVWLYAHKRVYMCLQNDPFIQHSGCVCQCVWVCLFMCVCVCVCVCVSLVIWAMDTFFRLLGGQNCMIDCDPVGWNTLYFNHFPGIYFCKLISLPFKIKWIHRLICRKSMFNTFKTYLFLGSSYWLLLPYDNNDLIRMCVSVLVQPKKISIVWCVGCPGVLGSSPSLT